jgi:hypothetical protein
MYHFALFFDFVSGLLGGRLPFISRSLLETMAEPLRHPLPPGLEYVRNVGSPIRVNDTRHISARTRPGQTIPELTRIDPMLQPEWIHPFLVMVHHILTQLLVTERETIYHGMPGEDEFDWYPGDSEGYQEPDLVAQQLEYYKGLFLEYCTPENCTTAMVRVL